MELLITWAIFLLLTVVVFYTASKARPVGASGYSPSEKAALSKRIRSLFAAFDVISWGLFIAAICFLVAAVVQTINVFG